MSTDSLKIKVAQEVLGLQDLGLVKQIQAILDAQQSDLWDELTPEQQASVLRGRSQVKEGKTLSTSAVLKKYKQWLTK